MYMVYAVFDVSYNKDIDRLLNSNKHNLTKLMLKFLGVL